jgi:hypothetical protein
MDGLSRLAGRNDAGRGYLPGMFRTGFWERFRARIAVELYDPTDVFRRGHEKNLQKL